MEESIMASSQNQTLSTNKTDQTYKVPGLQQAIQLRALELYEKRGREGGHELEDWLQAETELTPLRTKKAAA
jgi:hypothetical protein